LVTFLSPPLLGRRGQPFQGRMAFLATLHMILTITTTHQPATDLGYLLHKHPDKLQSVELAVGKGHVFYPEATEASCSVCLLLDINPIDLVRSAKGRNASFSEHYVNDKPYTSNSFLSTALVKAFGSAINGTCLSKPELVNTPIPLKATIHALKVDCELAYISKFLEPIGYEITIETVLLDEKFPSWGESKTVNLTIEKITTLKELLSQLYILMMILDTDRHYWISENDIDVLNRRGAGWLDSHPEREWITRRYLKNLRALTSQALPQTEPLPASERKVNLHQQRLEKAAALLKESGAVRVLDMGCGEGKLIKLLLREGQFKQITGMDVAFGELQKATENLYLDEASPAMRSRIALFQGSVTYKDERFKDFDAIVLVEVIEHLDEERLPTMERVVFGYASPKTVVLSTPNAEYNAVYEKLKDGFRHDDHRFEWTRQEFSNWCQKVCEQFAYTVKIYPVGVETEEYGAPSQIAVFTKG
jgi:3' terminal RNA ribose 2'-O-methyltransferase Hen1